MLLGIAGKICSGKATIVDWLVEHKQFQSIQLLLDDDVTGKHVDARGLVMTVQELMDFMMQDGNWQHNWVVHPIATVEQMDILRKRPFFFMLAVEAPLLVRYRRFLCKYRRDSGTSTCSDGDGISPGLLEQFVVTDDEHSWNNNSGKILIPATHADGVIVNPYTEQEQLHDALERIVPSLASPLRLRPCWDDYFMLLADLAAHRSNCMKRRVGCILARHGRVIATGYNGTPRGVRNCNDGGCPRCNDGNAKCGQDLSECLCLHAEENALLEAGRDRIDRGESNNWTTLYCNTCPCLSCAKKIVQSGVKEVVYRLEYGMDAKTADLFKQVGIHLRQHSPLLSLAITAGVMHQPATLKMTDR